MLEKLLNNNQQWVASITKEYPDFFTKITKKSPKYLWIGCSDARIPTNELLKLPPGEMFVHRNIANLVTPSDINCLSVITFAVQILKIKHLIICGHYGCKGIAAALQCNIEPLDKWLAPIKITYNNYQTELKSLTASSCINRLCELNVLAQIKIIKQLTIIQQAWQNNQPLTLHGWIYNPNTGLLRDILNLSR